MSALRQEKIFAVVVEINLEKNINR